MQKNHKVLITGSSGMLGIDLSKELDHDYVVCGVDIAKSAKSRLARFYKGDITDRSGIAAVIEKVKPGVVVHCAAWTDVDGCELDPAKAFRVNARGAKNVARACRKAGAVLVYISTDFVFDGKSRRPYRETDRPRPLGVYGASKLEGEVFVRKTVKEHFIVRTSWLYGKNGKNFVDTIIAKARTGKLLKVVSDQVGSPTYTKDLAAAIHALLDKVFAMYDVRCTMYDHRVNHGIYHICNAGKVSWCGYAKTIVRLTGRKTPVRPISSRELARAARRPAMSVLETSKFEKMARRSMRSWKIALQDYIRNERKLKGKIC